MTLDAPWVGELPPPLRQAIFWAWQTMLYAICKRAADVGVDIMDPAKMGAMGEESVRMLKDMFDAARAEAPDPWDANDLITRMVRKTIDWSVDHVTP